LGTDTDVAGTEDTVKVEILGVGCAKCHKLYDLVQEVVKKQGIGADVVKVEDLKIFASYGVFMTPALVVDGEVKVAGRVPKEGEIVQWLSA
jgi:small redox-active disulfide protein 2